MLFNKKPDEELTHDFSPRLPTIAASAVEPLPMPVRKQNGAPTRAVIDAGLKINGNLESDGAVQIDGEVHGDIRCAHLTVGKDACIVGNITAEEVVVRGKVKGVIRANRVILQDSARVDSQIFHKRLAIEEGAVFEGQTRISEDPMSVPVTELKTIASQMRAVEKTNGRHARNENGVIHA